MKKYVDSILSGFAIGIAALCFLKGGLYIGAALFAFGLSGIIYSKWPLYTGKAGFFSNWKELAWLVPMLLLNIAGTYLATWLGVDMNLEEAASKLVEVRVNRGFLGCLLPAIGCGFIMTMSVKFAREGKWIPLLLGIPTFVICGFPHCVADIAYYSIFPKEGMIGAWLGTVLGNFIGCNLPTYDRWRANS
ncbi:MAG: formate/nitrite transporter family protein [Bacteroides sp.]|nr:formate/nitrite transporter family protein [Bacteroides sp.]MDE7440861.1 formate/nitrite transporter family protein [Muribaculaceae bacterium]